MQAIGLVTRHIGVAKEGLGGHVSSRKFVYAHLPCAGPSEICAFKIVTDSCQPKQY